jgi:hypothetical protein
MWTVWRQIHCDVEVDERSRWIVVEVDMANLAGTSCDLKFWAIGQPASLR